MRKSLFLPMLLTLAAAPLSASGFTVEGQGDVYCQPMPPATQAAVTGAPGFLTSSGGILAFLQEDGAAWPKGTPLTGTASVTVRARLLIGAGSHALIRDTTSRRLYLAESHSIILLDPGKEPELSGGSLYFLASGRADSTNFFSLRMNPPQPEPGKSCRLILDFREAPQSLTLVADGYRTLPFYRENDQRHVARFGIDISDRRDGLPYYLEIRMRDGSRLQRRDAFEYAGRPPQSHPAANDFRRLPTPAKSLTDNLLARILQPQAPLAFPKPAVLLATTELALANQPPAAASPVVPNTATESETARNREVGERQRRRWEEINRERTIHTRALAQSTTERLWEGNFLYPAMHFYSSVFGEQRGSGSSFRYHRGIDIASPMNAPIKAPNHGRIVFAGHTIFCGKNVIIDHGQFVFSKIFHMNAIMVQEGQLVRKGEVIGLVGSTGISTGPHIHWETWVGHVPVDPEEWTKNMAKRDQETGDEPELADFLNHGF
jgi:hypothetical protein